MYFVVWLMESKVAMRQGIFGFGVNSSVCVVFVSLSSHFNI